MERWPKTLMVILAALTTLPAAAGRPRVVHPKIVAIHQVMATEAGAIVWLRRDQRGAFGVREVTPLRQPIRMWWYPEPMGEGSWIELMTREHRRLGTFRAAVPAPGSSCGVEVPLIRGTWWLLIYDEHDGMRRLLAHLEVGRQLAYVARRERLPVLGQTKRQPAQVKPAQPPAAGKPH